MALSDEQLAGFARDGFARIEGAFPRETAEACREVLWRETGLDPREPAGWTQPVIRLGNRSEPLFTGAANTAVLREAFDQLAGAGRWRPPMSMGSFVVRFPSAVEPDDAGWHVDASFPPERGDASDYFSWRVNARSKGRALLMLFLFSDVGEDDAPTRLRAGSHHDVARALAPLGEAGATILELAGVYAATEGSRVVHATGDAGTVYLCHPLLVHAGQRHRGTRPRFMAQPPLFPVDGA